MWIKWKYNDHGHPNFKELEIPADFDGYESVEEYICESGLVPTWSERFMASRIKWAEIVVPSVEHLKSEIEKLELGIKWRQNKINDYQKLLESL